jgi:hypothetical protein
MLVIVILFFPFFIQDCTLVYKSLRRKIRHAHIKQVVMFLTALVEVIFIYVIVASFERYIFLGSKGGLMFSTEKRQNGDKAKRQKLNYTNPSTSLIVYLSTKIKLIINKKRRLLSEYNNRNQMIIPDVNLRRIQLNNDKIVTKIELNEFIN